MKTCRNCKKKFSFSARMKSLNSLEIECEECQSRYKMKHKTFFLVINLCFINLMYYIMFPILQQYKFWESVLGRIVFAVVMVFILFWILSPFMKYKKVE